MKLQTKAEVISYFKNFCSSRLSISVTVLAYFPFPKQICVQDRLVFVNFRQS
jgi:hypothetical protein